MEPPPGPQLSPDGRWRWDGARWTPVHAYPQPTASRRRVPTWLIVTTVAVAVVVVFGSSLLAVAMGLSLLRNPSNQLAITCDRPMLRPGGPIDPPVSACEAKLARQVASLSCDSAAGQSAFDLAGFDPSGKEDDASVSDRVQAGYCDFRVPGGYSGALVSHSGASNPVAVIDFGSISGVASLLVGMRCTGSFGSPPCVFVRLSTVEGYQCLEDRTAGKPAHVLASGNYGDQHFPAPNLNIEAPNRLVVMLSDRSLVAYLNTRLVCSVAVQGHSVDAPVAFLVEATLDTSIRLTGFIVGEAS